MKLGYYRRGPSAWLEVDKDLCKQVLMYDDWQEGTACSRRSVLQMWSDQYSSCDLGRKKNQIKLQYLLLPPKYVLIDMTDRSDLQTLNS